MQVVWIEGWESWAPGDVYTRALRHEQRLEREGAVAEQVHESSDAIPAAPLEKHGGVRLAGPLFQPDFFATGYDIEAVMSAATQIALDEGALTQVPVTVAGGRLLMVWPQPGRPAFASPDHRGKLRSPSSSDPAAPAERASGRVSIDIRGGQVRHLGLVPR